MFDGIKIQDVSVEVDDNGQPALLTNDRLTFAGLVDTQTGFVLSPIRKAFDRGLTFRLVPRSTGNGYRVEVKGSLHKFFNNGQHNADQYTANALLLTLDQLVRDYGFNLFNSKINNIEFGVNLILPFPVSHVLSNLICYKNQTFSLDTDSDTPYYVCNRQQYAVKVYDKGKQKGFDYHLLRFEVRIKKMEYFNGTGVRLDTLADLLNVANFEPLGALLIGTFNEILFDDPTINPANLTPHERETYKNGRNPRFWQTPDDLTTQQATTHRQRLSRTKHRYRALLDQRGSNWQRGVTALIGQTWQRLTAVDDDLLTRIDQHRAAWQNLTKPNILGIIAGNASAEETEENRAERCHKLTDIDPPVCHELTDPSAPDLSRINPLYSGVICDTRKPVDQPPTAPADRPGATVCPVTGVVLPPAPGRRFVSATMLRNDDDLLLTLNNQFRQYAKGSKEDEYSRAAHNVRNVDSNRRNNLRRSINKIHREPTLFDVSDTLRLTADQRAALDYWQETPYEVRFT